MQEKISGFHDTVLDDMAANAEGVEDPEALLDD